MTTPTLTMIPSGYKTGKVYSVLPINGDGDFSSFTRNTIATRVNKSGLIETVASNIPRLDYSDGSCPSLLLEPESANLVSYSEDFNTWGKAGINVTLDNTISPSGILNADKIQRTSTSGNYILNSFSKTASQIKYTTSVFIKQGSGDYFALRYQGNYANRIDIRFQFSTKSIYYTNEASSNAELISTSVKEYSNGWFKISYSYLSDTTASFNCMFSPRNTNGNIDFGDNSSTAFIYLWGAQVEENSLTSYISTNGSPVTRGADTCFGAGNNTVINSEDGVLYGELSTLTELGTFRQINISKDSSNRIYISKRADSGNLEFRMDNPLGILNFSFNQDTTTEPIKFAFRYGLNNFAVFINGVNKNVSSSGNVFASGTLNELELTSPLSQPFFGNVKDLRYYNTALTDTELQQLTTI